MLHMGSELPLMAIAATVEAIQDGILPQMKGAWKTLCLVDVFLAW